MNLYFGEIHTHTGLSDGRGEPADAVAVGKAHLDFCALADHAQFPDLSDFDEWEWGRARHAGWREGVPGVKARWHEVQALMRDYYEPGQFVTFLAQEWSSNRWGDHNIYYLRDDEPLRFASSLSELYAAVEGVDAMVIPHHTAYPPRQRGFDWTGFDNAKAPVVEIFSGHGSSETDHGPFAFTGNPMGPRCPGGTVQRALDLGHVIGFIASSDGHDSFPGAYGNGLAAIYAPALTRESLWDALWQRRTYAVTGDRIRLDFLLNGHPMGRVISAGDGQPRQMVIEVDGWDCLDAVEIIKNGRVVKRWVSFDLKKIDGASRFKVGVEWGYHGYPEQRDWSFSVETDGGTVGGYQTRFRPPGFHQAQSSGPRRLDISSETSSKRGDARFQRIDLDVEGTLDTEVTIQHGGKSVLRGAIGELMVESKAAVPFGAYEGAFYLSRAIAEPHFHADLRWEDTASERGRDYYYVRVFQKNGQAAWSSPIWTARA